MLPRAVDVVVIGAGPSGSTLATLLSRYRPGTSVLLLERARFPRHKIGESLLVDVNRILRDMGALEEVEAARFSRKYGATFVWGDQRETFTFLWKEGRSIVRRPEGYQLEYTWHVDRPDYDRILMNAARRAGVTALDDHAVVGLVYDGDRVAGVRVRTPEGEEHDVHARFIADCAGPNGPAHRAMGGKQLDEDLRNIAIWGYLRGVRLRPDLTGEADERRTTILLHPRGWVWMIPLRGGVTSVGFVTSLATYRRQTVTDLRAHYLETLAELREHADLLAGTELVDYRGDGKMVHVVQEYSYQCDRIHGPGWVTCGDAAGFVDAILSIGCYVAQTHAQFLACALRSILDGEVDEETALGCYATTVRDNLSAFRAVAHMFYRFNTSMSEWWQECSEQLRKSTLVPEEGDKQSFLAFFTGFSARSAIYEEAVNSFGGSFLVDISSQLFGDRPLFAGGELSREASRARELVRRDPVLVLRGSARLRPFLLPAVDSGRLVEVTRLDLVIDGAAGPEIARRLYLPAALARVPALLDGRRRLSDVARELVASGAGADFAAVRLEVAKLAYRLACMGAIADAHERSAGVPPS